jgi:ribonuclease HI
MNKNCQPAVNPDLWEQQLELCGKHDVRFQWVKGHDGNKGSEGYDVLVSKAALGDTLLIDEVYEMNNN